MALPTAPTGRVVVALGGNAITPAGTRGTASEQTANIVAAMTTVAELVDGGYDVIVTHGNGPQVGNLLLKNAMSEGVVPPMPLDWCVAQTQATIGFTMVTALEDALRQLRIPVPVVAVVSRVLVDADDPAFRNPTKPIGRYLPQAQAQAEAERTGDTWLPQGARGWRRVVPSPEPQAVLDAVGMELVLRGGGVLVANGGGGIPLARGLDGHLHGVEAVIDKDLAAALLARELGAERLIILTDVAAVATDFGTARQQWLDEVPVDRLRQLSADGHFGAGSMGPKVEAAIRFVDTTGGTAVIGSLSQAAAIMQDQAGTRVVPSSATSGLVGTVR